MARNPPKNNFYPTLCLLFTLSAMIALLPHEPGNAESVGFGLTLSHTLVLIFGSFVISPNRVTAVTLIAGLGLTYFIIGVTLNVAGTFNANADIQDSLLLLNFILIIPFYVAIIIKLCLQINRESALTKNCLNAALCLYLVLGVTFALGHALVWHLDNHAFNFSENFAPISFDRFSDFLYYSFATITTLGSADILPASRIAKSLAILEAATGIFYLLFMISRLTTLHNPPPTHAATTTTSAPPTK